MRVLSGKVALITGASRGIGPAIARRLARERARLALVSRSEGELEAVASELQADGADAKAYPADVTDGDAMLALIDRVVAELGPIDILVNNAGLGQGTHFHEQPFSELREVVEVNLVAPLGLSHLVLPRMLERGQGHIVMIGSAAALGGVPYEVAYAATKAAVWTAAMSLRMEYRERGVSASVVVPGFVEGAGMYEREVAEMSGQRASRLLGHATVSAVADAVARAIRDDVPEIIVNNRPLRPLVAIGRLFPEIGTRMVMELAGGFMRRAADARSARGVRPEAQRREAREPPRERPS